METRRCLVTCCLVVMILGLPPIFQCRDNPSAALSGEAGFWEIEPVSFSFQNEAKTLRFRSSTIRISYTFHPADRNSGSKPLFVFFNGGPGCATSTGLLSLDTSPYTLNKERTGDRWLKQNPYRWTALGNLLYLDAPNSGFSYNLTHHASDPRQRADEFKVRNFNPFLDAAQCTRLLLRFLAAHPTLQANPVVLVGESYGGIRATAMLNLLLFYPSYGDGSKIYRDKALVDEIQLHLNQVYPSQAGRPMSPSTVANQFGRQVLIEPLLAGRYQVQIAGEMLERKGSPIYRIAAETGKTFTPCRKVEPGSAADRCNPYGNALKFVRSAGRDVYHFAKPANWFEELGNRAGDGLLHARVFSRTLGEEARSIVELAPGAREEAYRYKKNAAADLESVLKGPAFDRLPPGERMCIESRARRLESGREVSRPGDETGHGGQAGRPSDLLVDVLGPLNPWDDYLVGCNDAALETFYVNSAVKAGFPIEPTSLLYGRLFLQNLALVKTFITDAAYDLVIYAPALPASLAKYRAIVQDATVHDEHIVVNYKPGSLPDIPTPLLAVITFPHYDRAGHGVAASQPKKLRDDVGKWLSR
ncbi:MAG TPA: hypothetical protein PLM79_18005 [Syntrophobacteraceae bacterium]|nr:hypothetical protein [Syntrophobacteraceae bacterium]